jgi:hypothetical protein
LLVASGYLAATESDKLANARQKYGISQQQHDALIAQLTHKHTIFHVKSPSGLSGNTAACPRPQQQAVGHFSSI